MPKPGFKSITISESVYDKFNQVYLKNKDELVMKGVNSFAGYVTYQLEQMMQKDKTFARFAPKLEKISVDEERVILKDNIKNRIAEVVFQHGELYCLLCDAGGEIRTHELLRDGITHFYDLKSRVSKSIIAFFGQA